MQEPLPLDVVACLREFAAMYPLPQAPDAILGDRAALDAWVDQELRRGWKLRLAQQVRHRFGPTWGTKGTSPEWPSKEAIARQRDGKMDVWDVLEGAGSGRPKLNLHPTHYFVGIADGAYWMPVDAVDHLGSVILVESKIVRPPLPYLKSVSSFDWCKKRDMGWLDFVEAMHRPTMRLIVWSVFRVESGVFTFDQALDNFEQGLRVLRAAGLTAAPTFHADTRERGDTRDAVMDRTRRINAVCVKYLDVIRAARLYNEIGHGVEQSFLADPQFSLELDAMVDPRIPLAWGANHGGEPIMPYSAGGSWIAFHSDRSKTPEENAAIMLAAQERYKKPVVSDEPIGFAKHVIAGKRVNDLDWIRRQVEADKVLGGTTYHFSAGIPAEVSALESEQRDAGMVFAGTTPPVQGANVKPEQIAQVIAGAFFEDIATLLKLDGDDVEARRPAVHKWIADRVVFIDGAYQRVFKRPVDLEGAGSRVLLAIAGDSDAEIEAALVRDRDAGAK